MQNSPPIYTKTKNVLPFGSVVGIFSKNIFNWSKDYYFKWIQFFIKEPCNEGKLQNFQQMQPWYTQETYFKSIYFWRVVYVSITEPAMSQIWLIWTLKMFFWSVSLLYSARDRWRYSAAEHKALNLPHSRPFLPRSIRLSPSSCRLCWDRSKWEQMNPFGPWPCYGPAMLRALCSALGQLGDNEPGDWATVEVPLSPGLSLFLFLCASCLVPSLSLVRSRFGLIEVRLL